MRVLFPCGLFFPSNLGGPANTLYWLAKAMVKNDIGVSVVTSANFIDDGVVDNDCWTQIDGIRVRYCTAKGKIPFRIVFYSIKEINSCDIIIFSSICFLPNFFIAIIARLKHKGIIWSPRGELFNDAIQKNSWKLFYFRLLKIVLGKHVLFHATSKEEKKAIQNVFGQNAAVSIIPNYMELPPIENRRDLSPRFFLYLGRIAPIKALDSLIKGFSLSDAFMKSDFVLKIAGGVEKQFEWYKENLVCLVKQLGLENRVLFVGPISGKEKFRMYSDAEFSFLVSHSENFGNVVIESMSQGTPVVTSTGTPWSILEKEKAGFWINNIPIDIAKCIDNVFGLSSSEYIKMRENAYRVARTFDVASNIDKWVSALSLAVQY